MLFIPKCIKFVWIEKCGEKLGLDNILVALTSQAKKFHIASNLYSTSYVTLMLGNLHFISFVALIDKHVGVIKS